MNVWPNFLLLFFQFYFIQSRNKRKSNCRWTRFMRCNIFKTKFILLFARPLAITQSIVMVEKVTRLSHAIDDTQKTLFQLSVRFKVAFQKFCLPLPSTYTHTHTHTLSSLCNINDVFVCSEQRTTHYFFFVHTTFRNLMRNAFFFYFWFCSRIRRKRKIQYINGHLNEYPSSTLNRKVDIFQTLKIRR